jgi:hypothetical protein
LTGRGMSEPKFLKGPKFAEWLIRQGYTAEQVDPHASRLSKWRNGERVSVYKADEILIGLDRHLSELPDDFYCDRGYTKQCYPAKVRKAVIKMRREGASLYACKRAYGVTPKTVKRWTE